MYWDFTIYLKDLAEFDDQQADRLYEAGCSDGVLASGHGVAHISFARESPSLQQAIRSAISNIRSTGLDVSRVEIDAPELVETSLAQWGELTPA